MRYQKILTRPVCELILEAAPHRSALRSFTREAIDLDSVYISAREPDGISGSLIPADYYTKGDAGHMLELCRLDIGRGPALYEEIGHKPSRLAGPV